MIAKHIYLYCLVLLTLNSGCDRPDEFPAKKDYPVFETKEPMDISPTGVTFSADIISHGSIDIEDYGFIWRTSKDTFQVSLSDKNLENGFEFRVYSDWEKGRQYIYRAFIKTRDLLVLGHEISFISQGGKVPEISNFYPKEGFDGTLVTLTGHYFSYHADRNQVFVHGQEAEVVFADGDSLVFKIPQTSYTGLTDISVQVGSQQVAASAYFDIQGPEITSISAKEGHSGNYATLHGKYFTPNGDSTEVFFGEYKAKTIEVSDQEVKVVVPVPAYSLLADLSVTVRVINGLKTTELSTPYTIKKSWESKTAIPFSSSVPHESFTYQQKGYILNRYTKILYQYDPTTNAWNADSSYPGDDEENNLFIPVGNKVLKMGGYTNSGLSHTCWEYYFDTKQWKQKSDIPFGFYKATYFLLHNKYYIITDQGEVWIYHADNESFSRKHDFPVNYRNALGFSFISEGVAYAVTYGQTWKYNEQTDRWIEIGTNPFTSSSFYNYTVGFSKGETAYILLGGEALYKFDAEHMVWLLASYYPGVRASYLYKAAFTIGNTSYVAPISHNYYDYPSLMYSYQD